MKFCKTYQECMQNLEIELPGVGLKNLKKLLKCCRLHNNNDSSHLCPVCDGTFFPSLLKEMSDVLGCFNKRAQKLLNLHLATGFKKYYVCWKGKQSHISLIQQGQDLVTYALINAVAVRKILKKYDKIHYSKQGQAFKSRAQRMHVEILQSPWLCELMAFHINLRDKKEYSRKPASLFEGCRLKFTDGKPSLTCELFDSVKVDIDLTCSICLDTVFDPVALTCGHIFCYLCACNAASVTIVDGLRAASQREKCPVCREAGVYKGSLHLDELTILLSRRCQSYWEERYRSERAERIKQAKEHWDLQMRTALGV